MIKGPWMGQCSSNIAQPLRDACASQQTSLKNRSQTRAKNTVVDVAGANSDGGNRTDFIVNLDDSLWALNRQKRALGITKVALTTMNMKHIRVRQGNEQIAPKFRHTMIR
ncbi:hypothetical protein CKO18_15600 [Rhodoferax fermentans]|uniref:Uncharacterized protein n=1 Tax=Rhodoferax fermentans TaxID=28066 RepID=A0A1T1ATN8_RHOFE|nr:hypothetical protein [Rhodoferax fermentans]OOV07451.1 hypothetical protein RF819_12580 [Rhodoferax fermentans]